MKTTGFILRGLCILIFMVSNCYALELKVDALMAENSMVPKSYATVIKGKKGEVVAIGNSNTTYGPQIHTESKAWVRSTKTAKVLWPR